jgi:hypothetical protein
MADLSKMSDEELMKIAKSAPQKKQAGPDLSSLSDEDLLKIVSSSRPRPKISAGESALVGGGQGLTFDAGDEIVGGLRGAVGKLKGEGNFTDLYKKYRDEARSYVKDAQADNPAAYIGGNIAGTLALSATPVGAAFAPVRGAGALANIGRAAAGGALIGAGSSEADATSSPQGLKDLGKDIAKGASVAGLTQGVTGAAAGVLSKLTPSELRESAKKWAFNAATGNNKKAYTTAREQLGNELAVGEELLKKDPKTGQSVLQWFGKAENIKDRAGAGAKEAQQQINKVIKEVDGAVPNSFSGSELAAKMRTYADKLDTGNNDAVVNKIRTQAERFEAQGNIPLSRAQAIKDGYKFSNGNPDSMSLGKEATNKLNKIVADEMRDTVKRVATGSTNESYKAGQKQFHLLETARKNAANRSEQEAKNRLFSFSDYLVGGAIGGGSLAGGTDEDNLKSIALSVGGAVANKALRTRGPSTMALLTDKVASVLERSPELLKKYAPMLEKAARQGGTSLVAAQLALKKDPDYRRASGEENNAIQRRLGGQ